MDRADEMRLNDKLQTLRDYGMSVTVAMLGGPWTAVIRDRMNLATLGFGESENILIALQHAVDCQRVSAWLAARMAER